MRPEDMLLEAAVRYVPPPSALSLRAGVAAYLRFWWEHRAHYGLRTTRLPGMSGLWCPTCQRGVARPLAAVR
jgi:hypothetical protein